jgi:uncharacterized membrane protein YuzA (DUF378 family)
MKALKNVSFVLLVIGGLNWLLDAVGWNLVEALFGVGTTITKVVYIVVGLATLVVLFTSKSSKTVSSPQM